MLEYDRIEVSKGINANKANIFSEYFICHYINLSLRKF